MLDWNNSTTVSTDYADKVTRVTLSRGHVSFNVFQKDDYWLVSVQEGEVVIRADSQKSVDENAAKQWAETLYDDQWAALCTLDLIGSLQP